MIQDVIKAASEPKTGIWATVVAAVTLFFGASGVFGELHSALNIIWEVAPRKDISFLELVRKRFVSFTMVLGTGFLLLVSLLLSAGLTAVSSRMALEGSPLLLGHVLSGLLSFGVITVLFALIFKVLPDVKVAWSDVWIGATITSLLFAVGKFLLGLYLGSGSVGSAYGAAGALVIILVWVYYSAQILFFGAAVTQAYATRYGSGVQPLPSAERIDPNAQGGQA